MYYHLVNSNMSNRILLCSSQDQTVLGQLIDRVAGLKRLRLLITMLEGRSGDSAGPVSSSPHFSSRTALTAQLIRDNGGTDNTETDYC